MATDGTKEPKHQVSKLERMKRVNEVLELKLAGYTYQEIHITISDKYDVAKNTIDKYIMAANDILEEAEEERTEDLKALHLKKVTSLYKRVYAAKNFAMELKTLEYYGKLHGFVVDRNETTVKGDLNLSPEAFKEYDAALEDFDAKGA